MTRALLLAAVIAALPGVAWGAVCPPNCYSPAPFAYDHMPGSPLIDPFPPATQPISPGTVVTPEEPAMKPSDFCAPGAEPVPNGMGGFTCLAKHEDRSWHLLTQSYGGTVSLLRDLTKHECEFAMHRAKSEPATDKEIADAKAYTEKQMSAWEDWAKKNNCSADYGCTSGPSFRAKDGQCYRGDDFAFLGEGMHTFGPGDIRSAECFQ
jgi:hypothetical protein